MKISWAVFRFGYDPSNSEWYPILLPGQNESILRLVASGFSTERQAKKYVQHPDNRNKGSFVVLEVIEVLKKK